MMSKLRSRIERLEAAQRTVAEGVIQIGLLKRLPEDIPGEKHVAIVKRTVVSPTYEQCEFEERLGPAPPGSEPEGCRVYLTEDDMRL
jgi:hypothetical protein